MGNYMEDVLSQPDEIGQCLEYYENPDYWKNKPIVWNAI